ncbi:MULTISPECIES: hypothetical protein [unclassified Streptomyces]|uniref:hypothetical protein n=1 Tax=unclassified Streptomyces TaxID=2593676 RepID=UPI0003748724|nr:MULTISPECIES: hypothetical protein [unclassified Streptomyces]MYX32820.1 hypothetical protein [Streptomyces sp. SID8377]
MTSSLCAAGPGRLFGPKGENTAASGAAFTTTTTTTTRVGHGCVSFPQDSGWGIMIGRQ